MIFMKLFYMGIKYQHMHCSRMWLCCMKCLQTAIVTQQKSCHQGRSKYSWCKDTHTHSLTQYGGMVTPWWPWLRPLYRRSAPLDSHHCPPTAWRKLDDKQDTTGYSKFTFSPRLSESVLHFYVCVYVFLCACVSMYLFASRSECVVRWDKDASEPHPSLNSEINMYCAHAYSTY